MPRCALASAFGIRTTSISDDVIDTQDSRTTLSTFVSKGVQQVEQRIGAHGYAGFARQASPALAASLKREGGQQLGGITHAPRVMLQHTIETLGEDLRRAIWHITEPPSAVDAQTYGAAAPRQIERTPKVAAVLSSGKFATPRARNGFACRFGDQDKTPIVLHDHQHDLPMV